MGGLAGGFEFGVSEGRRCVASDTDGIGGIVDKEGAEVECEQLAFHGTGVEARVEGE